MENLKVHDKVRIVKDRSWHCIEIGSEVEVVDPDDFNLDEPAIKCYNEKGEEKWLWEDEFEIVK